MDRDEILNKISIRMQEINKRLNELSIEKRLLVEEQSKLIASFNLKAKMTKENLNLED